MKITVLQFFPTALIMVLFTANAYAGDLVNLNPAIEWQAIQKSPRQSLNFTRTTISDIAKTLSDKYGIKIVFGEEGIPRTTIDFKITDATCAEAILELCRRGSLKFEPHNFGYDGALRLTRSDRYTPPFQIGENVLFYASAWIPSKGEMNEGGVTLSVEAWAPSLLFSTHGVSLENIVLIEKVSGKRHAVIESKMTPWKPDGFLYSSVNLLNDLSGNEFGLEVEYVLPWPTAIETIELPAENITGKAISKKPSRIISLKVANGKIPMQIDLNELIESKVEIHPYTGFLHAFDEQGNALNWSKFIGGGGGYAKPPVPNTVVPWSFDMHAELPVKPAKLVYRYSKEYDARRFKLRFDSLTIYGMKNKN
jgi:hypothetical protein